MTAARQREREGRDFPAVPKRWEATMGATRSGTAAYKGQLYDKKTILQWASVGYGAIGTVLGAAELAGAVGTAAATGGTAATLGWSIWTLPIAAFALGSSIRAGWDEDEERIRQARQLIIAAAQGEAVEAHGRRYPRSKVLDPETTTGIAYLPEPKYLMVGKHFEATYRKWWRILESDLAKWKAVEDSTFGGEVARRMGTHQSWRQFVTSRFDQITKEYGNILQMAEHVSQMPGR
jgi:hypothetical protein